MAKENQYNIRVQRAIIHALNKKSQSGLSLFDPRKIRSYLYNENITLSDSEIAILSVEALNTDYDKNTDIDRLCTKLNNEFEFKKRFINQKVTPVNEYQLQAFCMEFSIPYPTHVNWKPILFKVLTLHVSTMYQTAYANHQLNKQQSQSRILRDKPTISIQEIKTMDKITETSSNVSRFLEEPVGLPTFHRPVTAGITYTINGKDVNTMTKQDLFDCAIAIKNSIYSLKSMEEESKAVRKEIKAQKKILKVVIKYLDAK